MKKRIALVMAAVLLGSSLMTGCGGKTEEAGGTTAAEAANTELQETAVAEAANTELQETAVSEIPEIETGVEVPADGTYEAWFMTDSSMFHVNEACEGKGILTVADGQMTIHITMPSKNVLNLYPGTAEEAAADGAVWLEPTEDEATYPDGMTETVYGFDIPVPYLNEEFDCALIGKKEKWYDHKVSVVLAEENSSGRPTAELEAGEYSVSVTLEGGTGRASVTSPAKLVVADGQAIVTIEWSSPNYDFMMVGEEKYLPVNTEGNSVFEIPVELLDAPMAVSADTVAMSKPHLIDYTLTFTLEN